MGLIRRPYVWFAALPALVFFLAGAGFIAFMLSSVLSGNKWALIPATWPGMPWVLFYGWRAGDGWLPLVAWLVTACAINAALLFAALASLVAIAKKAAKARWD